MNNLTPELIAKAKAAKNTEELLELAKENGVELSEEEAKVYKRGRNMSGGNVPKSATMSEYRAATGMEVLFGYLHLTGQSERIDELFTFAYQNDENTNETETEK